MALIHAAIIATAVLLVIGQCSNSHAAPVTEAELFWRSVLPDYPLPNSIVDLLHPETSYANKDVQTDARDKHSSQRSPSHDDRTMHTHHRHELTIALRGWTLFFHEEALQVGKNMTISFPAAASAPPLGLLSRPVADSIPFSTSSLPSALAQLGIAMDSVQAAKMKSTLDVCEGETLSGEAKFCATSLEALVEGAMAVLGSRDIRPVTSNLPRAGATRQLYTFRGVRQVGDGSSSVTCHEIYYAYTVYICHETSSTARIYMVEMEDVHSGSPITVAAVCHTDTSHVDPEHIAFKLLGSKPGGAPICHYVPYGDMIWVNKKNRSSS